MTLINCIHWLQVYNQLYRPVDTVLSLSTDVVSIFICRSPSRFSLENDRQATVYSCIYYIRNSSTRSDNTNVTFTNHGNFSAYHDQKKTYQVAKKAKRKWQKRVCSRNQYRMKLLRSFFMCGVTVQVFSLTEVIPTTDNTLLQYFGRWHTHTRKEMQSNVSKQANLLVCVCVSWSTYTVRYSWKAKWKSSKTRNRMCVVHETPLNSRL